MEVLLNIRANHQRIARRAPLIFSSKDTVHGTLACLYEKIWAAVIESLTACSCKMRHHMNPVAGTTLLTTECGNSTAPCCLFSGTSCDSLVHWTRREQLHKCFSNASLGSFDKRFVRFLPSRGFSIKPKICRMSLGFSLI